MKHKQVIAKVVRIIRTGYSYYGNPHYEAIIETKSGEHWECKTAVNAALGYGFRNYEREFGEFSYHITASGNIILDFAKSIQQ